MSEPEIQTPASPPPAPPSRDALLAAAAARQAKVEPHDEEARFHAERDERQKFRRLVSTGIEKNNELRVALESIRTLLKLADNIMQNPDEPKYRSFKPTNGMIKRTLVDPKGALEYAVAMGFRADVDNFQPLYVFHPSPRKETSMRIGAACLREVLERIDVHQDRVKTAQEAEKAAKARAHELVRLAYDDDRKEKQRRDQLEKQRREAVAAKQAQAALEVPASEADSESHEHSLMPGGGVFSILPLTGHEATSAPAPDTNTDTDSVMEDSDEKTAP